MRKLKLSLIIFIMLNILNIFGVNKRNRPNNIIDSVGTKRLRESIVNNLSIEDCLDRLINIINSFDILEDKESYIVESCDILEKLEEYYRFHWSYIISFFSNNYDFTKLVLSRNNFNNKESREIQKRKNKEYYNHSSEMKEENYSEFFLKKKKDGEYIYFKDVYSRKKDSNNYPINIAIKEGNINSVMAILDYDSNSIIASEYNYNAYEPLAYAIRLKKWNIASAILDRKNIEELVIPPYVSQKTNPIVNLINIISGKYSLKDRFNEEYVMFFNKIIEKVKLNKTDLIIRKTIDNIFNQTRSSKKNINRIINSLYFDIIPKSEITVESIVSRELDYDKLKELFRNITFFQSYIINEHIGNVLHEFNNTQEIKSIPLLHVAIAKNNYNLIKYLIEDANFNINILDSKDRNGLFFAKSLNMMKFLINLGIDQKQQDINW